MTSVLLLITLVSTAGAAPVPTIANDATPRDGIDQLILEPIWRLGGEDDEDSFFGVIDDVALDDTGNFLLADIQLMQVHVVDPDGELIGELGRQGEGPGEVTRLGAILPLPGDRVGLVQLMPGRVVMVDGQGMPAGEIVPRWEEAGGRLMLASLKRAGDGLVAAGRRMVRREETFNLDLWIAPLAMDGSLGEPLYHMERALDSRSMVRRELDTEWAGQGRWTATDDGRVILAPERNEYRLEVHGEAGLERVITREFESLKRTKAQKEAVEARMSRFRGRGRNSASMEVEVAETVADIGSLTPMPKGEVWIKTSRSGLDQPAGTMLTYDVFDSEGNFTRQIAVQCEGNLKHDALFPLADGWFIMVKGHADAMAAMRGTENNDQDGDLDDAAPLEIIGLRAANEF